MTGTHIVAPCLALLMASSMLTTALPADDKGAPDKIAPIKAPFDMPQLKRPTFPDRTVSILKHGAAGDGKTLNTKAFIDAIAACAAAGGGRVLVPAGKWLTGPIHLKSNINLHIAEGAEVLFSTNFDHYLPKVLVKRGIVDSYGLSPLIYARDCTNIAITGSGKLNGQGKPWWHRQYPNRPCLVAPINCRNVLMESFTITSGPGWTIHPIYCENVIVRKVKVLTEGPNGDGINPESCKNVLIEHCYMSTGDACIAIKSGKDEDGRHVGKPCENLVIRHCRTKRGHGGVVFGSEMSGDVRNVFVRDCQFEGTDCGIRMKSRRGRGGVVENIWVQDVNIPTIRPEAFRMNMLYGHGESATGLPPLFRNIHLKNITCAAAPRAVRLVGLPEKPIENITMENITISSDRGMSCSNVKGLKLINVNITPKRGPVLWLKDTRSVTIQKATCPKGTGTFLQLEGKKTKNIRLLETDLSNAKNGIKLGKGVPPDAVSK